MSGKKVIIIAIGFFSVMALFSAVIIVAASGDNENNRPNVKELIDKSKLQKVTINVEGMTCEACEKTIVSITGRESGVSSIIASYKNQNAIIEYDVSLTNVNALMDSVGATGYKVLGYVDGSGSHTIKNTLSKKAAHTMKCGASKCGASMSSKTQKN